MHFSDTANTTASRLLMWRLVISVTVLLANASTQNYKYRYNFVKHQLQLLIKQMCFFAGNIFIDVYLKFSDEEARSPSNISN